MAERRHSVSVVFTVLNEADSISDLLSSLAAQTRRPEEVVVVDGGSTDGTWETLQGWHDPAFSLVALRQPGANISRGRNEAIRASRGEIIAVTDAGVRLEPSWLAELLAPFNSSDPPDVVSGFFAADPRSRFELALGATTLPTADEIQPERFLPSSRSVAFLRSAWQQVGGYPEWLDYCEDLVFDLDLKRAGLRFDWAPRALVHFRPRPDARRFFIQYYRYARGDGKALLWTKRHLIRYSTYAGAPALLSISRCHPIAVAIVLVGGLLYCRRPVLRLLPFLPTMTPSQRLEVLAMVPPLRLIGDVAKMLGYPAGLWWRLRVNRLGACSRNESSATLPSPEDPTR